MAVAALQVSVLEPASEAVAFLGMLGVDSSSASLATPASSVSFVASDPLLETAVLRIRHRPEIRRARYQRLADQLVVLDLVVHHSLNCHFLLAQLEVVALVPKWLGTLRQVLRLAS